MRLINVDTYKLEEFSDEDEVRYVILSHRWEDEEVLFKDIADARDLSIARKKKGWYKIQQCCQQAVRLGVDYIWADTCCIDKSSSAELQEAINSMYRWYAAAEVCYVFLSDVSSSTDDNQFINSQWFSRGWTLQELLAPKEVVFFNADWVELGCRSEMVKVIEKATSIAVDVLETGLHIIPEEEKPCVAEIMSWARGRKTTRIEDRAYSLLGLFDVSMPMLYGEGNKAFIRLQEAILSRSDDQSIFAWEGVNPFNPSLLANSPDAFPQRSRQFFRSGTLSRRKPQSVTSEGITAEFKLIPVETRVYIALLNLSAGKYAPLEANSGSVEAQEVGFYVKRLDREGRYARCTTSSRTSGIRDLARPNTGSYRAFEMRQLTMIRQLRQAERVIYRHTDLTAFRLGPLNSDCDTWNYLIKESLLSMTGGKYDEQTRFWIRNRSGSGLVGTIHFDPNDYTANFGIPTPPIRSLSLAFDFDFNPFCVIAVDVGDFDSSLLQDIVDNTAQQTLDVDKPVKATVQSINGGRVSFYGAGVLAIKSNQASTDDGSGFDIRIDVESEHSGQVILSIRKHDKTEPWELSYDHRALKKVLPSLDHYINSSRKAEDLKKGIKTKPAHISNTSRIRPKPSLDFLDDLDQLEAGYESLQDESE